MQLSQYMAAQGLDDEEMASLVRKSFKLSCDRSTISRIRRGKSRPSWELIACLRSISKGRVSADDFLDAEARA
jgi:hypothetical protein